MGVDVDGLLSAGFCRRASVEYSMIYKERDTSIFGYDNEIEWASL